MSEVVEYRGRRINERSFFEPIYDPHLAKNLEEGDFDESDWDLKHNKGPCRRIFKGEALEKNVGRFAKFKGITFSECDLIGPFKGVVVFDNCDFKKCEFRGEFNNVKFSNCEFEESSLSLVKLNNCQFRDCVYSEIGLSGNETQLVSTDITHPSKFLAAAVTNLNHLPENRDAEYQQLRLQQTQATLARVILQNQSAEGSDSSYYDAVKAATLYGTRVRTHSQ